MELSTYFRINARNTGQFERTLIIAEDGSLCQLSGRLHRAAARREPAARRGGRAGGAGRCADQVFSTVQNWYPGDAEGRGGIYNFVTKRGACRGARSQDLLDPGGDRLGDHLEISVLRAARRRQRRRVLLGRGDQQPPAGRYRHQDDPYRHATRAARSSPRASAPGRSNNTYRGLVRMLPQARGRAQLHAVRQAADRRPVRRAHRALYREPQSDGARSSTRRRPRRSPTTSCSIAASAGLSEEDAVDLIVNGFCKEVLKELPMEFAVEAQKLLAVSLEGSVG